MGGLVCLVHRNAVLEFQTVPTEPHELGAFDAQMRELYNSPSIADSVVNDAPTMVKTICDILAKPSFTMEDRATLLNVIESLYEPYP